VLLTFAASVALLLVLTSLMSSLSVAGHREARSISSSELRPVAPAAPIPPPDGYPKLTLSTKTVTPTLAGTDGAILYYTIEIRNTGATTATQTTFVDTLPENVTYNDDGWASRGPTPVFSDDTLSWQGSVGFDSKVDIKFSVTVDPLYAGTVRNTAVIDNPSIARPVTVTADTIVTDDPILAVEKSSWPEKPGADKPLVYELLVTNWGQPTVDLPITVTDQVPVNTVLIAPGQDGTTNSARDMVTWTRQVSLELGQSSYFSFSVNVEDVPSGTIIINDAYDVLSRYGLVVGAPYTVTVVDPVLSLDKKVWPDPPGSNREMTYTLTVLNVGSQATDLTISDDVPGGVTYVRGGDYAAGVVSWDLDSLDTGESVEVTYIVYVSDVMNVPIVNTDYAVCSAEDVCASGEAVTSVVQGPIFEAYAFVDPIAHKPGGGTGTEVTPTLVVHNVGAGNAIDAQANLYFDRLSVSAKDLVSDPAIGTAPPFPDGPDCGNKCKSYVWVGSLGHGDVVTFTTTEGQSTIGGAEGTHYTATVVVSDVLSNMTTVPVTGTAVGTVTHMANVQLIKTAPPVIGAGQILTYVIEAYNRGLTTLLPPLLTDVVPLSTTFRWASDGGTLVEFGGTERVSWTLPPLSPGEGVVRTFAVRIDGDLVSGTQIVNHDYAVFGYGNVFTDAVTGGPPVTTTVQEVGLIHSFKVVTPQLSLPGPGNVLTYEIHLVNSSPLRLTGVTAYDLLPWADSTYLRNATASAGSLISDIISINWKGNIDPFSKEVMTASVLVDEDFRGALTNTVFINHPSLQAPVERHAVAYVTDQPVLFIQKTASPAPVPRGDRLTYRLRVNNLGQQATQLAITDVVPGNVTYVPNSATGGGKLVGDAVHWDWPLLESADHIAVSFQVTVEQGSEVVNSRYGVVSAEGVFALGQPVVTQIKGGMVFLPIVVRQ
jgi:uncharacterized repeat protein (TIGR01451 family)